MPQPAVSMAVGCAKIKGFLAVGLHRSFSENCERFVPPVDAARPGLQSVAGRQSAIRFSGLGGTSPVSSGRLSAFSPSLRLGEMPTLGMWEATACGLPVVPTDEPDDATHRFGPDDITLVPSEAADLNGQSRVCSTTRIGWRGCPPPVVTPFSFPFSVGNHEIRDATSRPVGGLLIVERSVSRPGLRDRSDDTDVVSRGRPHHQAGTRSEHSLPTDPPQAGPGQPRPRRSAGRQRARTSTARRCRKRCCDARGRASMVASVTQPSFDFSERVVVVTGGSRVWGRGSWRHSPRPALTS